MKKQGACLATRPEVVRDDDPAPEKTVEKTVEKRVENTVTEELEEVKPLAKTITVVFQTGPLTHYGGIRTMWNN